MLVIDTVRRIFGTDAENRWTLVEARKASLSTGLRHTIDKIVDIN